MKPTHQGSVKAPSNRSFGMVFAVFFLIVALLPLFNGRGPRIWAIATSIALVVIAYASPAVLTYPNRLWMKFGDLLHRVVSPVILGLLFFGMFTPIGSVMRLFRWDPMRSKLDDSAESYWIGRQPPGPTPDSIKQQF